MASTVRPTEKPTVSIDRGRNSRRGVRRPVLLVLGGLIAVGAALVVVTRLWPSTLGPHPASASQYRIVAATEGPVEGRVSATGSLALVSTSTVGTRGAGILKELRAAVGDEVKTGQVLAVLDTSTVKASLVKGELALDTARAKLDQAKKPYAEADISAARAAVESAKVKLQQTTTPYTASDLAAAELSVEQARQNLDKAKVPYKASELEAQRAEVRQAEYSAQSARFNLTVVQKGEVVSENVRKAEYEHNWYEVNYGKTLDRFKKGEVDQDKVTLEWNNLLSAKERLDSARAQSAAALASAENQIRQSDTALATARTKLGEMEAGPDATAIKSAQLALDQTRLKLDTVRTGPTPVEIDAVRVALLSSEQKLAAMLAGPDSLTVRIAQNEVDSAQATVDDLKEQVAATEVKSAIAGAVISLGEGGTTPSIGSSLEAGTLIATVADMSQLQVKGTVNEVDAAQVKRAQTVEIQVAAATGRAFSGQVASIDSQATVSQNVATYGVLIKLDPRAAEAGLKPGMSVTAQILTGKSDKAVLVPLEALQKSRGNWTVLTPDGSGGTESRRVTLGIVGQSQVQIADGLRAGEEVAIPIRRSTGNSSGPGAGPQGGNQPGVQSAPIAPQRTR